MTNESLQAKTQFDSPQRPTSAVEIMSCGMLTPLGDNCLSTAAAVRAGISAYQQSPYHSRLNKPMVMALVPGDALPPLEENLSKVPAITSRQQRLLRLLTPAIQQAMQAFPKDKPVPLILACPEKFNDRKNPVSDKLLQYITIQSKQLIDLKNSYIVPLGRAGGMYALESSMLLLEQGHPYVLLAAVDTYLDNYLLELLDSEDRILSEGVMDGFAPGEGAVALLLKKADDKTSVRIFPPGLANEPGHRYSKLPYRGDGLSVAISEAIEQAAVGGIQTVMAGFNGENMFAKEWGVSVIRNSRHFNSEFDLIHPADCLGDTGAAMSLIYLALSVVGISAGYYQKPVLVWLSSDFEHRAATCIS